MRNTEVKWIYGTADQHLSFLTLGKGFLVDMQDLPRIMFWILITETELFQHVNGRRIRR